MQSHEIIQSLADGEAAAILAHLQNSDRDAYRAAMEVLATRRKLRPVFLQRKPAPQRNIYMAGLLALKTNTDIATEILQAWLLDAHRPMIIRFLDALDIGHDGKGLLDEVPSEPDSGKVDAAVDALLEAHERMPVMVYLRMFAASAPEPWTHLESRLERPETLSVESTVSQS